MEKVEITTPTIKLDQFLKWIGVIDSGAQVKFLIEDELIFVNKSKATERRKKLQPGDIVEIKGNGEWIITGS